MTMGECRQGMRRGLAAELRYWSKAVGYSAMVIYGVIGLTHLMWLSQAARYGPPWLI